MIMLLCELPVRFSVMTNPETLSASRARANGDKFGLLSDKSEMDTPAGVPGRMSANPTSLVILMVNASEIESEPKPVTATCPLPAPSGLPFVGRVHTTAPLCSTAGRNENVLTDSSCSNNLPDPPRIAYYRRINVESLRPRCLNFIGAVSILTDEPDASQLKTESHAKPFSNLQ
jgi:hypothetical protein